MSTLSTRIGGRGVSYLPPSRPAFPLTPSSTAHYLVDANDVPFTMLGRVCWIITRLSVANYTSVLDDCVAKGFNTIEMKAPICPSVDNGDGKDQSGNLPFSLRLDGGAWTGSTTFSNINNEAPDFTTPVEAYWLNLDAFFAACAARNLLVCYFPAYVGYPNTDWWMHILEANGATKMQTYGAYVANRYINQKNLVWMIGGDAGTGANTFSAGETTVLTSYHAGLKSVITASALYAAEWSRGSIGTDLFASNITLNPCYSDTLDVNNQGTRAWAVSPPKPAFFQEMPFEESASVPPAWRRLLWWAFLSSGGYLFGNGVFTSFESGVYTSHMNTQGTLDAERQNRFLRSVQAHGLVPTQGCITAGGGTANTETEVRAMVNPLGTLMLVYLPPNHTGTVTIDMTKMSALTTARWWDPTAATFAADSSGLSPTGTHVFTKPGNNSAGEADLLLVLTA